jgi:hypothetical protein
MIDIRCSSRRPALAGNGRKAGCISKLDTANFLLFAVPGIEKQEI